MRRRSSSGLVFLPPKASIPCEIEAVLAQLKYSTAIIFCTTYVQTPWWSFTRSTVSALQDCQSSQDKSLSGGIKSTERNSDKCSHLLNYNDPIMTFLHNPKT